MREWQINSKAGITELEPALLGGELTVGIERGIKMSTATERTKQAEIDYKKKGKKRQEERLAEQAITKLANQKKQKARAAKAEKRKIAKTRQKG